MNHAEYIKDFAKRYKKDHLDKPVETMGFHPKHGLPKKMTTFYPGCCHVLYDRKTIPKGGKNIQFGCFIKQKDHYHLIYDQKSRALLGLDLNKIQDYRRSFDEIRERTSND